MLNARTNKLHCLSKLLNIFLLIKQVNTQGICTNNVMTGSSFWYLK